jgi:hypothetical protein
MNQGQPVSWEAVSIQHLFNQMKNKDGSALCFMWEIANLEHLFEVSRFSRSEDALNIMLAYWLIERGVISDPNLL